MMILKNATTKAPIGTKSICLNAFCSEIGRENREKSISAAPSFKDSSRANEDVATFLSAIENLTFAFFVPSESKSETPPLCQTKKFSGFSILPFSMLNICHVLPL